MNVFKIAWRSIQHRGFGSLLTIVSMALGVMMVVAVLTIHGVVSESFRANNSFGYNIIVGARGGGLQLTLNSVYYLSKPVENIPYEYYLAFCDVETREKELKKSIAYIAQTQISDTAHLAPAAMPGAGGLAGAIAESLVADAFDFQQAAAMKINKRGLYKRYTSIAVPLCLGDYYVDPDNKELQFRCVGTTTNFFTDLVLDIDTEEKFRFAQGRCFVEESPENGLFECVVGSIVAKQCDIKLGDKLQATHGDPDSSSAHIHEQDYTVVGIVERTGTPNDRVVYLNIEGFYLMEDHSKPLVEQRVLASEDEQNEAPVADVLDDSFFDDDEDAPAEIVTSEKTAEPDSQDDLIAQPETLSEEAESERRANATRIRLPIEQREITSVLVRTANDEFGQIAYFLAGQINEGDLETTLDWSPYRPERAQKASQAVNPVIEVVALFQTFVNPIRWLLLALTTMICVVSALSILVGIYNSMSQRQHEIAVMRALGANRTKVMMIILCEAILLALVGGLLGWIGGHGLNVVLGPIVESRTGVPMSFFNFAPPVPISAMTAGLIPESIGSISISPEFLIIPGLMLLAVVVGIYPAISAYRTDVSKSLGK